MTRSRGFATTVALMMVAFIAAAIMAVTSLAAADFRRTQDEWRDAQLRQIVVAAAVDARAKMRSGAGGSYELQLPEELSKLDASARVQIAGRTVLVTASVGGKRYMQNVEEPSPQSSP